MKKYLIMVLFSLFIFVSCENKEENTAIQISPTVTTSVEAVLTLAPTNTIEPSPTDDVPKPTGVEFVVDEELVRSDITPITGEYDGMIIEDYYDGEYIELADEQVNEIYKLANEFFYPYEGGEKSHMNNGVTCLITAYYSYTEQKEKLLPVVLTLNKQEAEKKFGGEWNVVSGTDISTNEKTEYIPEYDCSYGWLAVSQIEEVLLSKGVDRIYVLNDKSVDYTYIVSEPESLPFSLQIEFYRYYGDMYMKNDERGFYLSDIHMPA